MDMKTAKLLLIRKNKQKGYTEGELYLNGKFFCFTLEDTDRDYNKDGDLDDKDESKIYGETAIPYGKYPIILNMSPRFKKILPRLQNVKGFDGVLIHGGNKVADTLGCILVGDKIKDGIIPAGQSGPAITRLLAELNKYEKIYIKIE